MKVTNSSLIDEVPKVPAKITNPSVSKSQPRKSTIASKQAKEQQEELVKAREEAERVKKEMEELRAELERQRKERDEMAEKYN